MKTFGSVEEILDFAIANEQEANQFYTDLAAKMETPAMAKVFEQFAAEELGHKMKLEAAKAGEIVLPPDEQIVTLDIADYVVDVDPKADMTYADALILAMKKEKAAYRLYIDLAAVAEAEEFTNMFLAMAQEEAKHKLRFEIEYDDNVFKED